MPTPYQAVTPRKRFTSQFEFVAHKEFTAAEQEGPTFECQPSASSADTSCADAGIVAESEQSRSTHDIICSLLSAAPPHDAQVSS